MMLNVLIPLSGKNTFKVNEQNEFPKILNEVDGKLLIERAAEPFTKLTSDKVITVAVSKEASEKYQLQKVVSLLGEDIKTCAINGNTQGAACSALLAIESLDLNAPLIISSFEQVLDFDISEFIDCFIDEGVDAGVLTFEAIHPKWSFVKTDANGFVSQAAEKMPISNQAIAGLFYFKSAQTFVDAAQSMIRKDVKVNEIFYISPALNEIILNEGVVKAIEIDKNKYFHISDEHALEAFELKVSEDRENLKKSILQRTKDYIIAFNKKDVEQLNNFFAKEFKLTDPAVTENEKNNALAYIREIFESESIFSFKEKNIFITDDLNSIIEFELILGKKILVGVDVIQWNNQLLMTEMNAYLYEKTNG